MSFTYAGQWGPDSITSRGGIPIPNLAVTINVHGGGLATLYTDRTKGTGAANPASTDAEGNLVFWADPGRYDLVGNGGTITVEVQADIAEPVSDAGGLLAVNNLSDVASASTSRTNLGLGTAATHASTDFDATGAAATVQTNLNTEATTRATADTTETTRATAAETALNATAVLTTAVPGGAQGNDGLVPTASIAGTNGYLWAPGGQVYQTTGPPTDDILGANYTPQPGDSPNAFDPATGAFYTRALSPSTGGPIWVQVNPQPTVINGGT